MKATVYPLQWPDSFPRAKERQASRFQTSLAGALRNVNDSLQLFAEDSKTTLEDLVISSNASLGDMRPKDAGVAVWFKWDGLSVCVAVDRYASVEANLQAIHHIIEARRVELRHGTLALVRASFTGFMALPAPGPRKRTWSQVLGVAPDAPPAEIQKAYRELAAKLHPDKPGGSAEKMTELNAAYAEATK